MDMYKKTKELDSRVSELEDNPGDIRRARAVRILEKLEERLNLLEARLDEIHLEVERIVQEQRSSKVAIEVTEKEYPVVGNGGGDLTTGPVKGTMTTYSGAES